MSITGKQVVGNPAGILADAAARMGTRRRRQASHGVHASVQAVQKPEHLQMGGGN